MQNTKPTPAVCVLGRAMNLHNLQDRPEGLFVDKPVVQAGLFVLSAAAFWGLFLG